MTIEIKALVAINKQTSEIFWAEGCCPYGSSTHQVTLPKSLLTENDHALIRSGQFGNWAKVDLDDDSVDGINIGKINATEHTNHKFDNILIEFRTIELCSSHESIRTLAYGESLAVLKPSPPKE